MPPTIAIAIAAVLTACSGSSGISSLGPSGSVAKVRFVNGSPDAGSVQVFIDNQQQYCSNGNTGASCVVAYGQATTYAVQLKAGSHAILLKDTSGNTIAVSTGTISVNSGFRYSVILAGELHPSYSTTPTLKLVTTAEQPYNTPSSGAAVNAHYASPYEQSITPAPFQFGYYLNNTPTANALGQTVAFGSETTPQGLPSTALNAPITFYAMSPTSGITATPSQFSTQCASNALPCDTGNLSLYLIDGPAASTFSRCRALPFRRKRKHEGFFTGVFDPNG